jgi:hypothetical protein
LDDLVEHHATLFGQLRELAAVFKDGTSGELAAAEAAVKQTWTQVLLATRAIAFAEFELIRRYKLKGQQQLCRSSPGQLPQLWQQSTSGQQQQQPQPADTSSRPCVQHMDESPDVMAEESDYPCCLLHHARLQLERHLRQTRLRLQQDEEELARACQEASSAARRVASDAVSDTWKEMLLLKWYIASYAVEESRCRQLQQQQHSAAAAAALPLLLSRRHLQAQLMSAALESYGPFTDAQLREAAAHHEARGSLLVRGAGSRAELASVLLNARVMPPFEGVAFTEDNEIKDCQLQAFDELLTQQRQQQQQDGARQGRQAMPSSDSGARGGWMRGKSLCNLREILWLKHDSSCCCMFKVRKQVACRPCLYCALWLGDAADFVPESRRQRQPTQVDAN